MSIEGERAYLFAVVYIPEFRFPILDPILDLPTHHIAAAAGKQGMDGVPIILISNLLRRGACTYDVC